MKPRAALSEKTGKTQSTARNKKDLLKFVWWEDGPPPNSGVIPASYTPALFSFRHHSKKLENRCF
jgi:hypothetical protein